VSNEPKTKLPVPKSATGTVLGLPPKPGSASKTGDQLSGSPTAPRKQILSATATIVGNPASAGKERKAATASEPGRNVDPPERELSVSAPKRRWLLDEDSMEIRRDSTRRSRMLFFVLAGISLFVLLAIAIAMSSI
jgi:hypothetical protein